MSISSYLLFHTHTLSLSLSSFTFSSPPHLFTSHSLPHSPLHLPQLFIFHGFFHPLPLHLFHLFISHRVFPHLFTSPIDCTLNLLFKLSTTHYSNNWWCYTRNFFYPLCFYDGLCMKDAIFFFLFCSLIWFVDFVVCVITRIVVFIFILLLDLWVLNLGL